MLHPHAGFPPVSTPKTSQVSGKKCHFSKEWAKFPAKIAKPPRKESITGPEGIPQKSFYGVAALLTSAAALLLILVAVDKPYRDSQGHEGLTEADKLQLLTLSAQIANYGVAFFCLTTQEDRKAAGQEPSASGSFLSDWEELGVALATLFFTVAPLVPPTIAAHKEHQAKKRSSQAKGEDDTGVAKTDNPASRDVE
eukprot:COSAG04_NODE_1634_length_6102_cov_20.966184_4_plen_196_part_00